ncbi:MAG TPA: hypothetical protein VIJ57_05740, partial [Hanamia sp.]
SVKENKYYIGSYFPEINSFILVNSLNRIILFFWVITSDAAYSLIQEFIVNLYYDSYSKRTNKNNFHFGPCLF